MTTFCRFFSKEQLLGKVYDYIMVIPFDPHYQALVVEYTIISKNWKCRTVSNTLCTYSPSVPSLREMIQNLQH